jgi:hypothetical protein
MHPPLICTIFDHRDIDYSMIISYYCVIISTEVICGLVFDIYQNTLGNIYTRNVSHFKILGPSTETSDFGWKQKERFTIPILNNLTRVRPLPQLFRFLPLLSTKHKTFINSLHAQIPDCFSLITLIMHQSNFRQRRKGLRNCKEGWTFYKTYLFTIINSTAFVHSTTMPNKVTW